MTLKKVSCLQILLYKQRRVTHVFGEVNRKVDQLAKDGIGRRDELQQVLMPTVNSNAED